MEDGQWRLGRRPSLDGIRAIAVLLVLVCHTVLTPIQTAGSVGVTMFFTLSGFLITALILEERSRTGRVSLRDFYKRRALRLLPALVVYLASMAIFAHFSGPARSPSTTDFLGSLFYVGNYTTAMQGTDNVLVHTWSLAVEEQFYIVWPVVVVAVLAFTGKLRFVFAVAACGSVMAFVLRIALWNGGDGVDRIYYGTDTHMDGLLVGCMGAIWMHRRSPAGPNRPAVAIACLTVAVLLSTGSDPVRYLVVPSLVPLLVVASIIVLVRQPGGGVLTARPLIWLGRRSYGVYLWHFPLFGMAASLPSPVVWLALLAATTLTLVIAELSWRCVEEPFIRMKDDKTGRARGSLPDSTDRFAGASSTG